MLNEMLDSTRLDYFTVDFTSNGESYNKISRAYDSDPPIDELIYNIGSTYKTVYNMQWYDQAYRTITFATAPSGDLLTWLQANGTKQ